MCGNSDWFAFFVVVGCFVFYAVVFEELRVVCDEFAFVVVADLEACYVVVYSLWLVEVGVFVYSCEGVIDDS